MIRHALTIEFDTEEALTDEQIASARALIGEFGDGNGLPGGRVVDVRVTRGAKEMPCPAPETCDSYACDLARHDSASQAEPISMPCVAEVPHDECCRICGVHQLHHRAAPSSRLEDPRRDWYQSDASEGEVAKLRVVAEAARQWRKAWNEGGRVALAEACLCTALDALDRAEPFAAPAIRCPACFADKPCPATACEHPEKKP